MCQPIDIGITGSLELLGCGAGMLAVGAGQNDGFFPVLVQFDHASGETVQGNIDRIDNMPGGEVLLGTDIHQHGIFPVEQDGGLLGGQSLAGLAALGDDQQYQHDQQGPGQQIVIGYELYKVLYELHGGIIPRPVKPSRIHRRSRLQSYHQTRHADAGLESWLACPPPPSGITLTSSTTASNRMTAATKTVVWKILD